MPRFPRQQILERLRAKIARGQPIVGGGAGTGLSAKCEEAGGIDLIVIYNSGRYRMAGRGSLAGLMAYGNANDIVVDMAREVLPVVKNTPVLAGVNGTDPFMLRDQFLRQLGDLGFSGVQNFPTVGLIDGTFRANLEETGMGYGPEVDLIRAAHELDLFTTPYVFNPNDAIDMARAGADVIVCHLGLTTGGSIGAETAVTLEGCVPIDQRLRGSGAEREPGRHRLVPRRPDCQSAGRRVHPARVSAVPRLLWRLQHGAAADRDRIDRTDQKVRRHHPHRTCGRVSRE